MKREELLSKGYTEEQVTDLLNLFQAEQTTMKAENSKLKADLNVANSTITNLSKIETDYKALQQSQMTDSQKIEQMKKEAEDNLAMSRRIVNQARAKTILSELGEIDEAIIDTLVSDDLAKTEANAKSLVDLIKNRDEATVKKTKESITNANILPPNNSNVKGTEGEKGKTSMTKEEFSKLSHSEKIKIFKEDKDLWAEMTK